MSEVIVRMEMPIGGCLMCDARCVSALYGYVCGIKRKNVMPFLDKINRPDWCPIVGELPEQHGDLINREYAIASACSGLTRTLRTTEGEEKWIRAKEVRESIKSAPIIVPAERSET